MCAFKLERLALLRQRSSQKCTKRGSFFARVGIYVQMPGDLRRLLIAKPECILNFPIDSCGNQRRSWHPMCTSLF